MWWFALYVIWLIVTTPIFARGTTHFNAGRRTAAFLWAAAGWFAWTLPFNVHFVRKMELSSAVAFVNAPILLSLLMAWFCFGLRFSK